MPKIKPLPPLDYIKEILDYNPKTGNLTWKVKASQKKQGDVAGYISKEGYVQIGICSKIYLAHRIAWKIYYSEEPPQFIDHIDGNKSNNIISNLRLASNAENMQNGKIRANNTTGYKGVCFNKKLKKYQANICKDRKQTHLGLFETAEEAHAAYCEAAKKLHGLYYNEG